MNPIKTTITTALLKSFLKISFSDDDALIDRFIKTATNEAQEKLNNDFHEYDEEGNLIAEKEAPEEVQTWILNRAGELYETRGKTTNPDISGIKHHRIYPFSGGE
jgi:uncharacterized phage protein (predicted DNA packaging)